ncbi:hypothetical protein [Sphaerotilus sp.]|uniref:hypothetical protein n=1 Tax=Sphaerotilus sp. TaxID=2093942 RepID=UPI002ACE36D8|nr:hypothetical protein [Sphaerotilus sp.]MDZ7855650.1 hypothetical protein [Sphaerotilus sp.]
MGADDKLETCAQPVGTVRLQDGNASADTRNDETASNATVQSLRLLLQDLKDFSPKGKGQSDGFSIDSLRLLIQQSNCLVIVDRGAAEGASSDEKRRTRTSGEVRDGANMGQGQEVAADFVLRAVVLSAGTEQTSSFNVGSLLPIPMLGGLSTGQSTSTANVQLVLSDVRAKIQLAVAQGAGSGKNTSLASGVLGRFGGGQIKTENKTQASTVMLQAFADAYNKLVPALRNYKAQTVKGGLGAGGTLGVSGGATESSRAVDQKAKKK